MSKIDISDLNIELLILKLWENQIIAAFFSNIPFMAPQAPSLEEIRSQVEKYKYIDYIAGRCIKTDFSDLTKVDTRLYNRDAGNGTFEKIVENIRKSK